LVAQTVIQATAHLVALTVAQLVVRMEQDLMEEMVLEMLKTDQAKGKMMPLGHGKPLPSPPRAETLVQYLF
jgi:hypothetical protein